MNKVMSKDEMRRKLDLFFTKDQLDAYKLVHPDLGGMGMKDAAKELGITEKAVRSRLDRMKEVYPYAFRWQDAELKKSIKVASLNAIYGGYRSHATQKKVPFELTKQDVYELIMLPCDVCGKEPYDKAVTEDGIVFTHNYLRQIDNTEGYTYLNMSTVCPAHSNKSWRR